MEHSNRQTEAFIDEGIRLGGVTIGQIVDTIDKIYSDPRVTLMDITEVMPLVSGRLIRCWTEKELDEIIAINVKLKQCEGKEKKPGEFIREECGSLMKEKYSYLQKLKKK